MRRVLLLGASSAIARAVARRYAATGARLYLVARTVDRVASDAAALRAAGAADVLAAGADLAKCEAHAALLDEAWRAFGGFDRILIAYGTLTDERAARTDWRLAAESLQVNLVSPVALLDRLLERLNRTDDARIAILGSVAGDRGRDRVAMYGAAKAGLERYVEALQQRSAGAPARLTLVKPGWVRSPMTAQLRESPLVAAPDVVARSIVRAMERGWATIYVPAWWRVVMLGVRMLPDWLFRRMHF